MAARKKSKLKWEDTTTYPRRDETRTPRCWSLKTAGLELVVHRWMNDTENWYMTLSGILSVDRALLLSTDIVAAKQEAIARVRAKLAAVHKDAQEFLERAP